MSLTTKPKPKPHYKKRQAQHHRRSKHYMKAYFPYLPMFGIIGMGMLVNKLWSSSGGAENGLNPAVASSRLGLVTGNYSSNFLYIVLLITFVAFAVFVLLHWYRVKRLINRGEAFVVQHPWFDVGLVFVVTAGVVLTRS